MSSERNNIVKQSSVYVKKTAKQFPDFHLKLKSVLISHRYTTYKVNHKSMLNTPWFINKPSLPTSSLNPFFCKFKKKWKYDSTPVVVQRDYIQEEEEERWTSLTEHLLSGKHKASLCQGGQRWRVGQGHGSSTQAAPHLLRQLLTLTHAFRMWFLCEMCSHAGGKVFVWNTRSTLLHSIQELRIRVRC